MLNSQTPFHAKNREEFEKKVEASNYNLREQVKENLTIECMLFLSHCLQHNEELRKTISDLVNHPYITKNHSE